MAIHCIGSTLSISMKMLCQLNNIALVSFSMVHCFTPHYCSDPWKYVPNVQNVRHDIEIETLTMSNWLMYQIAHKFIFIYLVIMTNWWWTDWSDDEYVVLFTGRIYGIASSMTTFYQRLTANTLPIKSNVAQSLRFNSQYLEICHCWQWRM